MVVGITKRKPSFEDQFNASREFSQLARPIREIPITEVIEEVPETKPEVVVKEPEAVNEVIQEDPEIEPPIEEKVVPSVVHHELLCPHAELIQFWKPATAQDLAYVSPYYIEGADTRYVTFEPGISNDLFRNGVILTC